MYMEYPFQIFQTAEHLAITFEWSQVYRLIYTAGQPTLHEGIESWMGNSRGRWEGDVLVVEVTDHNDRTWLDAAGTFHSNALRVTERYAMRDANTIDYEATIEDPNVFERPWTIRVPLHRQTDLPRIYEYQCQAEKEEANGAFERDPRTWYPAPIPAENAPFDARAGGALAPPEVTGEIRRRPDGKPDLSGWYQLDAGGGNYGLESSPQIFLTPASRGLVVDPADGKLPYQTWARAERIAREAPHRGYDDPTAHCFVAGIPRSHYVPQPVHILQPPGYVVVLFERMSWRHIALNPRPALPDHVRLWQGDSQRPLGRRHARRREQEFQRQSVAQRGRRHRRATCKPSSSASRPSTRTRSSIARPSATRSRTLARGRSRCRCIAGPTSCSRSRATRTTPISST